MKLTTFVSNKHEMSLCRELGVLEVILSHRDFSRFGKLTTEELVELSYMAKELGMEPVFEWDILMTQNDFEASVKLFEGLDLSHFSKMRLQDPGAIHYIFEKHPEFKIQLNLENGNHNLVGIKTWIDHFKERLDRVILSIELPKDTLTEYCEKLGVPIEFLGLGRILLFYTPRNLLTNLLPEEDEKRQKEIFNSRYIEATGESEESPHKGFPLIENKHGTFMFHIKEHYLLDFVNDLKEMKLDTLRIDLRFGKDFSLLKDIKDIVEGYTKETKEFKKKYPSDVIRGFFHVNKSDVLFKKLKNSRIIRQDESYVGEVIEAIKGEFLGINLKNPKAKLRVGDKLKLITPVGKEVVVPIVFLKNAGLVDIETNTNENLVFMNYVSNAWVKTQVYLSIGR